MAAPGPTTDLGLPAPRLAEKIGYLREIDIFRDLTPAEMDWLQRTTTMFTCEKGQVIYTPGETGEVLFLLKRGRVQIYRLSTEGKKLVVATLEPGTFFGEMALLDHEPRSAVAETLEPSRLWVLHRDAFTSFLARNPPVAYQLIRVLCRRLREANARLEGALFADAPSRVARTLLQLAAQKGSPTPQGLCIDARLTHQELAQLAGVARETVTRVLCRLQDQGLLRVQGRRLILPHPERLEDEAAGQADTKGLSRSQKRQG